MGQGRAWRFEVEVRGTGSKAEARIRTLQRRIFAAPWAPNQDVFDTLTVPEVLRRYKAMQPGVWARQGTSSKHPVKIPSLIGIEDVKYLDSTGKFRHRSVGDVMRYAIVNQALDMVAHYGDFQPVARFVDAQPGTINVGQRVSDAKDTRYSDEQLYALALYLTAPVTWPARSYHLQSDFRERGRGPNPYRTPVDA